MASVLAPRTFSPSSTSVSCAVMGSFREKSDEKHDRVSIDTDQVDTGAQLVAGVSSSLGQEESLRIRYGLQQYLHC